MHFHVSPILLAPSSVILPGNWGRIIKLYNRQNAGEVLFREKILESIRLAHYPDKPSRLNAIFLLESLDEAKHFRDNTNKFSIIYEVAIIDGLKPVHRGDYYKVSPPAQITYFDGIESSAHAYWSGEAIEHLEIVVESPVKIIRLIG